MFPSTPHLEITSFRNILFLILARVFSQSFFKVNCICPALHLGTLGILCVLDTNLPIEFLVLCLNFYFLSRKRTRINMS